MFSHDEQGGSGRTKMLAELMHHLMGLHGMPSSKEHSPGNGTHPDAMGTKIGAQHEESTIMSAPKPVDRPGIHGERHPANMRSENQMMSEEHDSKPPAELDSGKTSTPDDDDDGEMTPFHEILGRKPSKKGMW